MRGAPEGRRRVVAAFRKEFENQDSASLAHFCAVDAKLWSPGSPMVEGRDAIRVFFGQGVIPAGVDLFV